MEKYQLLQFIDRQLDRFDEIQELSYCQSDKKIMTDIGEVMGSLSNLRDTIAAKKHLNILLVEPGQSPRTREIENSLLAMQKIVGGYIEVVPLGDNVLLVCNEEGKLNGSLVNRNIFSKDGDIVDTIYGTFFLCYNDGSEEFTSLPDDLIEKYEVIFK